MRTAKLLALFWVGLFAYLPPASGSPAPLSSQEIFKKWAGAVVTVETPTKTGTGFFDGLGYLYTAYHVLDGASTATVTFPNGRKASITGALVADKAKDYAILQIDSKVIYGPGLGDYAAVQPGERVTVIGSPRGLAQTVTEGIVSAKRQDGERRLLQLSAGISPGSSGSPVFNTRGEVVGLVVETLEGGQTLNFAVSSADLKGFGGIPLARAFAAPASPGNSGSALCHQWDQRFLDLIGHQATGYVGLKDVLVTSTAGVPEELAGAVSPADLRQWVADALSIGGVEVCHGARSTKRPDSYSDIGMLRWEDSHDGTVDVRLASVRSPDGVLFLWYELSVCRAGIIMPGWVDTITVDTLHSVEYLGFARDMKEDIRQEVARLAAQIVSRYQYANPPSDAGAASVGH